MTTTTVRNAGAAVGREGEGSSPAEEPGFGVSAWLPAWLHAWGEAWGRFWFTPADPMPLGWIRIAVGCLLAWSMAVWLLDVDAFLGESAWLPPTEVWRMNDQPWQWSGYFAVSSPAGIRLLAGITLLAAVLLAVGLLGEMLALVRLGAVFRTVTEAAVSVVP